MEPNKSESGFQVSFGLVPFQACRDRHSPVTQKPTSAYGQRPQEGLTQIWTGSVRCPPFPPAPGCTVAWLVKFVSLYQLLWLDQSLRDKITCTEIIEKLFRILVNQKHSVELPGTPILMKRVCSQKNELKSGIWLKTKIFQDSVWDESRCSPISYPSTPRSNVYFTCQLFSDHRDTFTTVGKWINQRVDWKWAHPTNASKSVTYKSLILITRQCCIVYGPWNWGGCNFHLERALIIISLDVWFPDKEAAVIWYFLTCLRGSSQILPSQWHFTQCPWVNFSFVFHSKSSRPLFSTLLALC